MSHRSLLEYIQRAKLAGASEEDISRRLHDAGWYSIDVHDALELHAKLTSSPAAVAPADTMLVPTRKNQRSHTSLIVFLVVLAIVGTIFALLVRLT